MIINIQNIEKAKKEIKKANHPIIVQAQSDNFNRKILEYGKFDILLSVESGNRRQTTRQLDSGLNHVLAKIAHNNNIAIGIDTEKIKTLSKDKKAKTLARIKQNINICKKAKTKLAIINAADKKDAFNLLLSLGASTQQAKQAVSF